MVELKIKGKTTSQPNEVEIGKVNPFVNPETVTINKELDGLASLLFRGILTPQGGGPPPNQPPVIQTITSVMGKINTELVLQANIIDPDGTLEDINWKQISGPNLGVLPEIAEGSGIFKTKFTPSLAGTYLIEVEAFDNQNSRSSVRITVQVPDTAPTGLIYDCNTTGKWGQDRTITTFDPLFPKPFVNGKGININASGSNKKLVIKNKVGTFSSGSGHPRWYLDSSNYNTFNIFDFWFLDRKARNFTQQRQSRHQMGGDGKNRFGGFNHEIDIENQQVALKIELWHDGGHVSGGSKSLPKSLVPNQKIKVRNTDKIEGRKVRSKSELDYLDGQGWRLGIEKVYDLSSSQYDFIFNAALYKAVSSEWFRMNPNETSLGFAVQNLQVFQL